MSWRLASARTRKQRRTNAIGSLRDGFAKARHDYIAGWQDWIRTHAPPRKRAAAQGDLSAISLAVLRAHESKAAPGGLIASLAIPWGFSKGDNDMGGYHLVWSRDMVEAAGGLLAAGAVEDVRRVLAFLQRTQQPDGHWSQNMWLDGSPYWNGIQMDETALPILLVDLARREHGLSRGGPDRVLADGPAGRGLPGSQRPRQSPGSLGGGPGLFTVHGRRGNRRAAGGRGPGRLESRSIHCDLPPRDRRCVECLHRTLDVRVRHGLVPEVRRRRVLRSDRPGADGSGRTSLQKDVARQERNRRRGHACGQSSGESRRPGPGALWGARSRRPAHHRHGQPSSMRCSKSRHRRAPPGIVTTTTATASTWMVRRSTAPGLVADGPCSPASGHTTNWRQAGSGRPSDS